MAVLPAVPSPHCQYSTRALTPMAPPHRSPVCGYPPPIHNCASSVAQKRHDSDNLVRHPQPNTTPCALNAIHPTA
ncbi:proline-rich receptor-like protein kinase PERK1 [Sesbania bispinosa]|nr:proline-rich receptor-like protein kinase PERK1 [Sesbania bispinosa]